MTDETRMTAPQQAEAVEVTCEDVAIADEANEIWARAMGGPSAAAIAAALARQAAETRPAQAGGGEGQRPLEPGFQAEVADWMLACFGPEIAADQLERADRFTEEALELAQTMPGFTANRAHALVDYVFGRDVGQRSQEVGGVMVTLAALCNTAGIKIADAAKTELARIWTKVETIRAKQAAKPTGSALPVAHPALAQPGEGEETYGEWQQKRGMLADKVDWAILEYDEFMLDDAYDAQRVLDRIVDGLRTTRAALSPPTAAQEGRDDG